MEGQKIHVSLAKSSQDYLAAKELILEYVAWLGMDLSFQNFDNEINQLQAMYAEPDGGLLLVSINGDYAGVAGIRKFEKKECELKRMFVKNEFRNIGIGKLLLLESIDLAKKLDYEIIKLDTADFMKVAVKLYVDNGFIEIPPYRHNPHEEARYFELRIKNS